MIILYRNNLLCNIISFKEHARDVLTEMLSLRMLSITGLFCSSNACHAQSLIEDIQIKSEAELQKST